MNKVEWGPWLGPYDKPEIGDYVQVEGTDRKSKGFIRHEGFVTHVKPSRKKGAWSFTISPRRGVKAVLHRWRKGKLPGEPIAVTRRHEEDA